MFTLPNTPRNTYFILIQLVYSDSHYLFTLIIDYGQSTLTNLPLLTYLDVAKDNKEAQLTSNSCSLIIGKKEWISIYHSINMSFYHSIILFSIYLYIFLYIYLYALSFPEFIWLSVNFCAQLLPKENPKPVHKPVPFSLLQAFARRRRRRCRRQGLEEGRGPSSGIVALW